MPVVECPTCATRYRVDDPKAGKLVRCKCGVRFDSVTGMPEGVCEADWRDEPIVAPEVNPFDFRAPSPNPPRGPLPVDLPDRGMMPTMERFKAPKSTAIVGYCWASFLIPATIFIIYLGVMLRFAHGPRIAASDADALIGGAWIAILLLLLAQSVVLILATIEVARCGRDSYEAIWPWILGVWFLGPIGILLFIVSRPTKRLY